jgi:hypothetical protein
MDHPLILIPVVIVMRHPWVDGVIRPASLDASTAAPLQW